MDGYKTFTIAIILIVGGFVSLYLKVIDADACMKILASACGMVGMREFAVKLPRKD